MTKIIASYSVSEHDITGTSKHDSMVGEVTFICGMLAMITGSKRGASHVTPLSKQVYYTHKILTFNHITNS